MHDHCERPLESWTALQSAGRLSIRDVVRYTNDFSTCHLALDPHLTAETGVPHFVVGFGRDKEPFCSPDLVGQVHHQCQGFDEPVQGIVVMDGEARIHVPVKAE